MLRGLSVCDHFARRVPDFGLDAAAADGAHHGAVLADQKLRGLEAGDGAAHADDGGEGALLAEVAQVDQFVEYVHEPLNYTERKEASGRAGFRLARKIEAPPENELHEQVIGPVGDPTPTPALNSQFGLRFKSIQGTSCCCWSRNGSKPVIGPSDP